MKKMTLGDVFEVGLDSSADAKTKKLFANWKGDGDQIYPSEEDARKACPLAFRDVESRWNRAGAVYREYPLADGRVVIKRGIWWTAPDPPGEAIVFYFSPPTASCST